MKISLRSCRPTPNSPAKNPSSFELVGGDVPLLIIFVCLRPKINETMGVPWPGRNQGVQEKRLSERIGQITASSTADAIIVHGDAVALRNRIYSPTGSRV